MVMRMQNKTARLSLTPVETTAFLWVCCVLTLGCARQVKPEVSKTEPVAVQDKQTEDKTDARSGEETVVPTEAPKPKEKVAEKPPAKAPQKAPAKPASVPSDSPKANAPSSLSDHEVTAVFKGVIKTRSGSCNGRTANCGNGRCAHYRNKVTAQFAITAYQKYQKNTPGGESKQRGMSFNLYSMPPQIRAVFDTLTLEDTVRLHWQHTHGDVRKIKSVKPSAYATGGLGGMSNRKVIRISRKITRLECIGTCGKGADPYRPLMARKGVHFGRIFIDNDGSIEPMRLPRHRAKRRFIASTVRSFLSKSLLKRRIGACIVNVPAEQIPPKGRMGLKIGITKNKPLKLGVNARGAENKAAAKCVESALRDTKPFHHHLKFNVDVRVPINYRSFTDLKKGPFFLESL